MAKSLKDAHEHHNIEIPHVVLIAIAKDNIRNGAIKKDKPSIKVSTPLLPYTVGLFALEIPRGTASKSPIKLLHEAKF